MADYDAGDSSSVAKACARWANQQCGARTLTKHNCISPVYFIYSPGLNIKACIFRAGLVLGTYFETS